MVVHFLFITTLQVKPRFTVEDTEGEGTDMKVLQSLNL